MSSPDTFKVEFIRTATEDPRPWAAWAAMHWEMGHPPPEHGPWEGEPDYVEWFDKATGWPCMARRGPGGSWNGYVCVPRDHPLHGAGTGNQAVEDLKVHGGITFADQWMAEGDWWFGFDCNHAWDQSPGMPSFMGDDAEYRTLEYVTMNVTLLALQLKELA